MSDASASVLRDLPSVDHLLQHTRTPALIAAYGRPQTVAAIRAVLAEVRADMLTALSPSLPQTDPLLLMRIEAWLRAAEAPTLLPVINATGVVLHTNLGRAPLSTQAAQAVQAVASRYNTLEYDLERGERGSRMVHTERLLQQLTGAEAALVVNNNAAAVLLALTALARRKRVVISRTQLVEIGGGFRIPDVMTQSGAKLMEVGATNRVHLADYADALQAGAALLMRVHPSNFRIIGFTTQPSLAELVSLAHEHGVDVLDDLGSGVLLDTARYGLAHEPTVQESLTAGADLVCFSGDKLLGGPQAGILVGRADLIHKLRKHPLTRAVRADKLCLAALSATLLHYLRDEAEREIPVWRMIAASADQLRARAESWVAATGFGSVIPGQSTVGGGSLPEEILPTSLWALTVARPNAFLTRLRRQSLPVIARIQADQVVFDPRTVLSEQDPALMEAVRRGMGKIH